MPDQVRLHPKVERQLASMEKQVNAPAIAAGKARKIIQALIQGQALTVSGLLSGRPDRRLKNSLKFNLGSGFRLICIRTKKVIYVMFAGDHDACDAWLDKTSKKKPHKKDLDMAVFTVDIPTSGLDSRFDGRPPDPADKSLEDPDFPPVSQEDLRRVFKGLTG
ncbi:hypothetical protein [Desulfospira joergensenii]|uniref:hypothetical protein n=1 Tax=Desulfospira joergensenii TaxID=53329 RepID=UPI0003B6A52A|nr:hypothetical protein [Desulfospira joergensenii]